MGWLYPLKVLLHRQLTPAQMDMCRNSHRSESPLYKQFFDVDGCAFRVTIEHYYRNGGKIGSETLVYNAAGELTNWTVNGVEYRYDLPGKLFGTVVNTQ